MSTPAEHTEHTTVPPDYRGVWVRIDASGRFEDVGAASAAPWARWLQTSLWHAHLCLPTEALLQREPRELCRLSPAQLAALSHQRAHVGGAQVQAHPEGELCTWLRQADYQPPAQAPDAAWIVFLAPDRLMRIGLHADESELWQRLPDSVGRFRCLAGLDARGQDDGRRVLVAGAYAMHARLHAMAWPRGMGAGLSLTEAMVHCPDQALHWLDRELSFGRCEQGRWTVERSTLPAREGQAHRCQMQRDAGHPELAWVELDGHAERWRVLEWSDT